MTEIIMKLRKCAEDLSQIADALARQISAAATKGSSPVTFNETTLPEISRLDALRNRLGIPVVVGRTVDRASVSFDLATMPHLLVGGATGQGKSMFIHGLINGLISTRSPEEVRLMLFDPKRVEFLAYTNLPHLVVPVMNENRRLVFALHWAVEEMRNRLKMFASVRVRNIQEFNSRQIAADGQSKDSSERVPSIVIVLDEIADAVQSCGKEIVPAILRLTAKARSAGIHLVLATQLPECNVITGALKANIPGRIVFKTVSSVESKVLLDDSGAESLIGKGDCLYRDRDGVPHRVQVPYISDEEIAANVEKAMAKCSMKACELKALDESEGDGSVPGVVHQTLDGHVEKAKAVIRETGRACTSHFMRRLGWGYNLASEVTEELEKRGIVGPARFGASREVFYDMLK